MSLIDEIPRALKGPRPPRVCLTHEDGYRYVRSHGWGPARRWAAWERQRGRMRRVGTLTCDAHVTAFLLHLDQEPAS